MGSDLLLTNSQELHLLGEEGIASIMNIINESQQAYDSYTYASFDTEQKPIMDTYSENTMPIVISNEDYSGPFEFDVKIKPQAGNSTWVFSEKLQKIFLLMSSPFPVDYHWNCSSQNLYVRATPLFSAPEHAQELVKRCLPHGTESDPSNKNIPRALHHYVLRCQNSTAVYNGHNETNHHFSVVIPLDNPQTGQDFVRVLYLFVCKNSCSTGMNRRSLEVVFTLEDDVGNVYGRKKIGARVCSCPKRDKEKEEQNVLKGPIVKKKKLIKPEKRLYSSTVVDERDTKEYTITVCGKRTYQDLLRAAYNSATAELFDHGPNDAIRANREKNLSLLRDLEHH